MNIQQHERIARIKQVSRSLSLFLTAMRYLFWGLWPLAVIVALFVDASGTIKYMGDIQVKLVDLSFPQRIVLAIFISVFFFFGLRIIYYCRELTRHFANGDIFNKKAVAHARKALFNALVIYGVQLSCVLAHWGNSHMKNPAEPVVIDLTYVFALMLFGLIYVLLWVIEIGCDLNEESELTI
jgi:hypothetical protein